MNYDTLPAAVNIKNKNWRACQYSYDRPQICRQWVFEEVYLKESVFEGDS
ncbi:MAG: hypothetical protein LBB50_00265 [Oscillospiraceae bacterium]|jgi:hypothetical protein|nr:hypothetical protein [Oscillospiraceae bacterium]